MKHHTGNRERNKEMIKLSWGQTAVLTVASLPMAAAGIAGGIASYYNFAAVLPSKSNAISLVLAGEAVAIVCALVALAVTLMGQHTPGPARAGLWLAPLAAATAGVLVAPDLNTSIVMGLSPMAMTAAGEGVTLVARRVVAFRTGVDIEQQRRAGLLVWHANRAANGSGLGRLVSKSAVWRLTKQFAATDAQTSVQVNEVVRYRVTESSDDNLAAVLTRTAQRPSVAPAASVPALAPAVPSEVRRDPHSGLTAAEAAEAVPLPPGFTVTPVSDELPEWMQEVLADAEDRVALDEPKAKLLTADDVAVRLNVKPGTVRTYVSRGKLRVHEKDANGRNLFHEDDVAKLGE